MSRLTLAILSLIVPIITFGVAARTAVGTPAPTESGLAAYWQQNLSHATHLGQVNWSVWDSESVESEVNWSRTTSSFYEDGPNDYFAVRLIGEIEIPEEGDWLFNLGSDDCARLWIDGELVVDDGSPHSYRSVAGSIYLTAGTHRLEIRYLERSYLAGLVLEWMAPSQGIFETVPAEALSSDPGATPEVPEGGLRALWQLNVSHAENLGQIDWRRYDTSSLVSTAYFRRTTGAFYDEGPNDYFSVRLLGTVEIPTGGTWQFSLGSEDCASLLIDGQVVIYDGDSHSYRWSDGTVELAAGTHEIDVRCLEISYIAGLALTWQGPTDAYHSIIPADSLTPADPPSMGVGDHGLRAYWSHNLSHALTVGQVDWDVYDLAEVAPNVYWRRTTGSFHDGGPTDYFGVRLVGTVDIPYSGSWRFNLGSEDGAFLWIDDQLVVADDASHSFRWRDGSAQLAAGTHTIEVRFLERSYIAGLALTWRGHQDDAESIIPGSALTPAELVEVEDDPGGFRAYWQTNLSHATRLGEVDWTLYDSSAIVDSIHWTRTTGAFYEGGPNDYFAVRLVGDVTVDETDEGLWTFGLGSEDCARMWIDGQLLISDGTPHSYRWQEAAIELSEGTHRIEVHFLEQSYIAGLALTWQGPNDAYESIIPPEAVSPAPLEPSGGDLPGGLRAFWHNSSSHATKLGHVDWTVSDLTSDVRNVYWRRTTGAYYSNGPSDYFNVRLLGRLDVPRSGTWTFNLGSEDGARLWIDGELVVNDDSSHSYRWSDGSLHLSAGEHDFDLRFQERSYIAGLALTWQGPGDAHPEIIPQDAFTPVDMPVVDTEGHGLRAYWCGNLSHATMLGHVDWYAYDSTAVVSNAYWRRTTGTFYANGPSDYFGVRLAGEIEVPEGGEWTFFVGSEDGARLWIDGQLVVNDDASHSFRWQSGAISLNQGRHNVELRFFERSYIAGLTFAWQGPSDEYESIVPTEALYPEETLPVGGNEGQSLTAKWYTGYRDISSLDQVDWDSPTTTTQVRNPYWRRTTGRFYADGPTDYFACCLTGRLNVPEAGQWTFGLGSEDGARLYIDDELVVTDDTAHSFRWVDGVVSLAAGRHDFRLEYYERSYIAGVVATWRGPGDVHQEVIPGSAFVAGPAVRILRWSELDSN